jgi:hypothetical protein
MINSTEIVSLTRQIISEHGNFTLYEKPLETISDTDQLHSLLRRAAEMDAETLAGELVDSLELLEESDVIVEEIIEYVGNQADFQNFDVIADDDDLSEHTPIYLLEKHGAF